MKIKEKLFINKYLKKALRHFYSDTFPGSAEYWENRYKEGGNSGPGSYNRLADFKAKIINQFITDNSINNAIEFGCGDGNNLKLINYPKYIGLDVSPTSIKMCIEKFSADFTKSFYLYNSRCFKDNHQAFKADLTLSLDVIYHLIEEDVFTQYMDHLFMASQKYVIIYSTNYEDKQKFHQKNRKFTDWIIWHQPNFKLVQQLNNPFKHDPFDPNNTSDAGFYIYENIY